MTSTFFEPAPADATIVVATLISAGADRDAFAASLRRELTIRVCADGMALRALVTADAVDVIVADLQMAARASVWQAIRSVVDPPAAIPVVLWLSLTGQDMRDLMALAADAKPDAVIIREIDDASAMIASAIRSVRDGNATHRVMQAIERIAPPSVRALLVFAARVAERPLTVRAMAARAGVSPRALIERLRAAGLPPARELISWLRVLHVAARLDGPRVTVEQVAEAMRFSSSGAARHLLARMTRLTPTRLRDAGGFPFLIAQAERVFRGTESASAGQHSPLADLGRPDRRLQCAWYESRGSQSR